MESRHCSAKSGQLIGKGCRAALHPDCRSFKEEIRKERGASGESGNQAVFEGAMGRVILT